MLTRSCRFIGVSLVALSLAGLAGVAGCSLRRGLDVDVAAPAEGWNPRTAVDVRNYHGSVTIIVDPLATTLVPSVSVGAKPPIGSLADSRATESVQVVMDWVEQEGGRVLKVRTGTTWQDPREVWADVVLRMPSCAGASIWNRGGVVEIIGASGAIQVDNGKMGDSAGPIRVRSNQPVNEPIALTTEEGTILLQLTPNSVGTIEMASGDGRVELVTPGGRPDYINTDGQTAHSRLNGGTNPIILRAYKGTVCAMVMDNPEAYTNKVK